MANSCVSPGSSGGGLRQGSIGFKKIGELTADEKAEHELIYVVRIASGLSCCLCRHVLLHGNCVNACW